MKRPKITVLMSVYNGEEYLKKAIESILNQTFVDFEFLIIDDGSTDETAKILKGYKNKDKRIKIVTNKKNIGLTKSLNKGLKLARGKYIARMDADDISNFQRLEKQKKYLDQHPKVLAVGSNTKVINENDKTISANRWQQSPESIYYTLTFYTCLFHSSLMLRKNSLIKSGGYNVKFPVSQDTELLYRLSRKGKIAFLEEILIKWRKTGNNISSRYKAQQSAFTKKQFIKNIKSIMGPKVKINNLLCFHNEGFPDRHPINISLDSLLTLEKLQSKIVVDCPKWLKKQALKKYADKKLEKYLWQFYKRKKFITPACLSAFLKFKKPTFFVVCKKARQKLIAFIKNEA